MNFEPQRRRRPHVEPYIPFPEPQHQPQSTSYLPSISLITTVAISFLFLLYIHKNGFLATSQSMPHAAQWVIRNIYIIAVFFIVAFVVMEFMLVSISIASLGVWALAWALKTLWDTLLE